MNIRWIPTLLVLLPAFLTAGGQSDGQSGRASGHKAKKPQFGCLYPAQTREETRDEAMRKFERKLNHELMFDWMMSRGEADLHFVGEYSYENPKLFGYEIFVRLTFNNGKIQDFPTRVIIPNLVQTSGNPREHLTVIAILPIQSDVKLIQLFDHLGILTWEAHPRPSLFAPHPGNAGAKAGEDYTLSPAFQSDRSYVDDPSRTKRQDDRIRQGIYPPRTIPAKSNWPVAVD